MKRPPRELTPRQARFVAEYLKTGDGTNSAITAGYSPTSAKYAARNLLGTNLRVKEAVALARAEVVREGQYGLQEAVKETSVMIAEAQAAKQFSAVARLLELKAKLHGLLIERQEIVLPQIDIAAAIEEARRRVALKEPIP